MTTLYAHSIYVPPTPEPGPTNFVKVVQDFYDDAPVETGGALNRYSATFEEIDDGDVYVEVRLPLWSQNERVVDSVLKTVTRFRKRWGSYCHFYARDNEVVLHVYFHVCNPD